MIADLVEAIIVGGAEWLLADLRTRTTLDAVVSFAHVEACVRAYEVSALFRIMNLDFFIRVAL